MAHVVLTSSLRHFTGGQAECEIDAKNVRKLFQALAERFPDLGPHLDDTLAVAIDGQIHQDDWFAAIAADSEVHVMPRIGGG